MAQVLSPGGVKPTPWRFRLEMVDPRWRWFWQHMGADGLAFGLQRSVYDPLRRVSAGLSGGASWVGTRYGSGIDFSSSGDEVYLGDAFDPSGADGFTFGVLIRPDSTTTGKPWCSWNDTGSQQQWLIQTSTECRAYARTTAGIQELSIDSNRPPIAAGEWAYIVGRFDGVAGQGDIFKNGQKFSGNSFAADTIASVTPFVKIGAGGSDGVTQTQFTGRVLLSWATRRAISDEKVRRLSLEQNWFAPWRPARRRRVFVAAAGGNVDVSATTDALTLTENAATISYDVTVTAGTDALTLTENAASVTYDVDVQAATASLTLAENAAAVSYDINVSAGVDALTLTEQAASVSLGVDVAATTATLTLTEQAATVQADTIVLATTDALSLTESQATIGLDVEVTAGTDALTLAEQAATVSYDIDVQTTTDALTLATLAATVDTGLELLPAPENALGPDSIHRHLGPDNIHRHLGPD